MNNFPFFLFQCFWNINIVPFRPHSERNKILESFETDFFMRNLYNLATLQSGVQVIPLREER